jgi:hypothetical protein
MAAVLLLTGCENYVVSEKPWFRSEHAAGVQQVRSGWWVVDDADCPVDPNVGSTAWPDCANLMLVPEDWAGVMHAADGTELLLARGDPMIAQYELVSASDAAVPSQHGYLYFGVNALKRDEQGRAVALNYWPALCGPPRSDRPVAATRRPWPGLHVRRQGGCLAKDLEALRGAIKLSGALSTDPFKARWVRDWRSGDQGEADWLAAQGIRTH